MTLSGNGFVDINPENNIVKVCGFQADVIDADSSSATIVLPQIITESTLATY